MENPPCNLCQSTSTEVVYTLSDWLLDRPEVTVTFVRCKQCGLIFQNPRPAPEEMAQHYPPDYEPYHNYETKKTAWLLKKAIEYGFDNRARAVLPYKKNGYLLDLGCAAGDFLDHMLHKYGWQVCGVEISDYAASIARKKHGLNILTGDLQGAGFADHTFDAVTMWDVLEHVHNPAETLQEIHRILKPGGILAFRVPNGGSFDARVFGRYWSGLDAPRHLYVFEKSTVSQLLEKNGFEVIKMTSRHGSYLGVVLSLRMMMVAKQIKPSRRDKLIAFMYHPIARIAFAPLFFLYSLLQNSSQLMVSARVRK